MAKIDKKNNIVYGPPEPINFNDGTKSLGEFCYKRFTDNGDYAILIDGITSEVITSKQLRDRSMRVAECLRTAGIRSGDRVGICAENRSEFAYALFGTLMAGGTWASLNVTYTDREIHHGINLSKPRIIFCSPNTLDRVIKVTEQNNFIEQIILFGEPRYNKTKTNIKISSFYSFINNINVLEGKLKIEPQNIKEHVAVILCSSGTTGLPKGVQLTEQNIMIGAKQHMIIKRKAEEEVAPEPIILSVLPWFHSFGSSSLITAMTYKNRIVFLPKFEERSFLNAIQNHRINLVYMVPPLLVFLAKNPIVNEYDLSSLKIIFYGAAPLSKEIQLDIQNRLLIPILRQSYGMTEGTFAFTSQTDDNKKIGSVGVARAGLQARVINIETGENLPAHQRGEINFKGSIIMKGYINDNVSTKQTIDSNGWLHTGDIGYYDDDGEFFIVDRLKELIKYKGYQVPPAEIEGLLLQNPKISDAGVIGIPDDLAGELPLAFVVKQPGVDLNEREVIDFIASKASSAKRLHGGVIFVDAIPKNPSGKILRRNFRELMKNKKSNL